MKRKKKYAAVRAAVLGLAASLLLSGCSVTGLDARALMHPPRPTGEKADIYALLESKAGKNFTLKYPAAGEYRSAIIQHNLCGDSHPEAIALYQRGDDDTSVNILFTAEENGKWQDIGSFSNPGAQVDRVCFGDLDGDGTDEVIVGWGSSAGSASTISVFKYAQGKMNELKLDQTYNEMALMDFDGDGKKELFTANLSTDDQQQFTASLFRLKGTALQLMGSIRLDTGISKFSGISVGDISKGQTGVMLDCVQTNGKSLTELLYWDKKEKMLQAPLYNAQSPQQNVTLRDLSVNSSDVDNNAILEFPIVTRLPGYTGAASDDVGNEVQWNRFDAAKGSYTTVSSMLINARDGYRLILPDKWKDTITTKQDISARKLTVYTFDLSKGAAGSPLLVVQIFSKTEWESKPHTGFTKVLTDGGLVTAISCPTPKAALAISAQQLKKDFQTVTTGT